MSSTWIERAAQDNQRWWWQAACRDADPELFFPISSTGAGQPQVAQAKAVCARCQVRAECLGFALASPQVYGIWGGTTEEERYLLRRLPG